MNIKHGLSARRGARALATMSLLAIAAMSPANAAGPAIPTGAITGLDGPESAIWDAASDAWFLSTGALSGDGAVLKIPADTLEPEPFIDGLGGPQGISIHEGNMYIADQDHVQVVRMDNTAIQTSIPTGGGASDVDVDPVSGDIFVSDLGGGAVWRIHEGVSQRFASIGSPDGLYVKDGGVFIANFALNGAGGIFRFDIATGSRTTVSEIPGATLDGLEPDGDNWLATDFTKGHLWSVAPDGSLTVLGQLLPGSADLGLDPVARIVAVPNLLAGVVVFLAI